MITLKFYNKSGVEQTDINIKVSDSGLTFTNLRSGGCGKASFIVRSLYENDTNLDYGYYVELYDNSTGSDVLVYTGKIMSVNKVVEKPETKEVSCHGFAVSLDNRYITCSFKGCTVKQAIVVLMSQFPPEGVTFSAANVAEMDYVLSGDGYCQENIKLSQAITDLCNLQTDGNNNPYFWYVDKDRIFHTAAQPTVYSKAYSMTAPVSTEPTVGALNVVTDASPLANRILAIGGNKANGQPVKVVVQELTSIDTYGFRATHTDISNAADNGAGLIRITSAAHGLNTGEVAEISSVEGTTEANDTWVVTVIDVDTFDLNGSAFVNAYTSGGECRRVYAKELILTNTRIKDQGLLETWALGQLSRLAYPVPSGTVELSAPGDLTLTGQDYVRITGFTGSPAYHEYHPVSVTHKIEGYNKIKTNIQISNFKASADDILGYINAAMHQVVNRAAALAGDQAPEFKVPLQRNGVFLGGGTADYVIGESPAIHEADAGVTTGGFLGDQHINFSGSFTIEFDLEVRARSFGMATACYCIRNDAFSVELYDVGGTVTCPNFNVYDPAGWESCQVALADAITTGDKKKIRVGFNASTKRMYLAFDGVEMCSNTGNAATSAAGDYKIRFGGGDANKLLDWMGNVKIEMQYREAAEIMIPSIQWLFPEQAGTKTTSSCGKYTATLDGGVAADILWRGSVKQSVGTATIKTSTGQIVTVTGSDLTLTDDSVNFIFAGSDGAWHADTTNTYLDTDANAILCYIATVIDGVVTGVRDVRPVGGVNRETLYAGTGTAQVNLSAIPGVFRSVTASCSANKYDEGFLADATAGNIAIDLTDAEEDGKVIVVKKSDSSANTVSYSGSGLVDGAASRTLTAQNQSDVVQFDGTNWQIKASYNTVGTAHTQNTDTGTTNNTFTVDSDSVLGKIVLDVATGAADKSLTITNAALTDDRTATFQDKTGTVALTSDTHTQNTDTGTTSQTFQLQSGSSGAKLKNNSGVVEVRNAADAARADFRCQGLDVYEDANLHKGSALVWTKRAPITVTNATAGDLTDMQVQVDLTYDADMNADFSDIRFTSSDGTTLLSHWLQEKVNSTSATFWVKCPSLPVGDTTIYVHYGCAGAASASSGTDTFIFFDGFDSDTLGAGWTFVQSGYGGDSYSLTANPGSLRIVGSKQDSHDKITLMKRAADSGDYVLEVKTTATWDANYTDSGLYVGNGGSAKSDDRVTGEVIHDNSAANHFVIRPEKMLSSSRTVGDEEKIAEPSFPASIIQKLTKNGNNYYNSARVGGTWYNCDAISYASTATSNGLVCNNDDFTNTFTADFDDFRVRAYASADPACVVGAEEAGTLTSSEDWGIWDSSAGALGIGGNLTPTAHLHIGAGTATAGTAPVKLTSGTSLTSAEAGAVEFTTDDLFFTITTGTARKRLLMADAEGGLTSGKIPIATTNGRLKDGPTPLAGTKVYYVSDSSGGAVDRKLTFVDGILTAET